MTHKITHNNSEERWNSLQENIKNILTLNKISRDEWFKCFHNISHHYYSQKLYNSIKLLLEERVLQLLSIVQTENTGNLLENYYGNWQKYYESIKTLDILYNHNRSNNKKHTLSDPGNLKGKISPASPPQMRTRDLGLEVWEQNMLLQLKDSLPKLLIYEINKLRHNISITTSLDIIASVIGTFVEVQGSRNNQPEFYNIYFEQPFLNHIREHFKSEASKLTKELKVSEYFHKVLKFLEKEECLLIKFLPEFTCKKVSVIFYQQIVIDNSNLIQGEFETILKEERFEDLYNIYQLLLGANYGYDSLAKIFNQHIEKLGKEIIAFLKPKQIHKHFVEELLKLHERYKRIVKNLFYSNFEFTEAFNKAFTVIINYKSVENQPSKCPEYLSKYCDMLLNKSHKHYNNIDDRLLRSIGIFEFIVDKDLFQSIYQKQLAQRLLLQQSLSMELEELMINNLKKSCGYEFTINLHKMLVDIKLSDKLNAQFISEHGTAVDDLNISFYTYVLETRVWPLGLKATSSFVLPEPLKLYAYNFEMFHEKKLNRQKLTWLHHLSWGVLKLNYLQKTYMVTLQTIQMSILLLFNDCDTLKYSEISDALQLTNDQFEKCIDGLLECKLLLFDGNNVTLNWEFSYTNTNVRVPISADNKKKKQVYNWPNNYKI